MKYLSGDFLDARLTDKKENFRNRHSKSQLFIFFMENRRSKADAIVIQLLNRAGHLRIFSWSEYVFLDSGFP